MRYIADHDFHIHSTVSSCCRDENQTPLKILEYATDNSFNKVCLTNHFWDETVKSEAQWHPAHTYGPLTSVLPLPSNEKTQFLFGAEVDMDYNYVLGIGEKCLEELDFVVVATTHLHLKDNTVKGGITSVKQAAELWLERFERLLEMDLPFYKIGVAHLTCGHIYKGKTPEVIKLLTDEQLYSVFSKCSEKGAGVELNMKTLAMNEEEKQILLRPYYIAKDCGCKFYLGSDAHKTTALENTKAEFEDIITLLDLKEEHKFGSAQNRSV